MLMQKRAQRGRSLQPEQPPAGGAWAAHYQGAGGAQRLAWLAGPGAPPTAARLQERGQPGRNQVCQRL
jgi:hypothetical protein